MSIDLLIAPAARGKTAASIDRILAVQKDHPLAAVWVLVPNPQAAAQFKARLADAGSNPGEIWSEIALLIHGYECAFW